MKLSVLMRLLAAGATAAVLASGSALAGNNQGGNSQGGNNQGGNSQGGNSQGTAFSVPEFDPAAVGAIAALVAGGGVLLARRKKN